MIFGAYQWSVHSIWPGCGPEVGPPSNKGRRPPTSSSQTLAWSRAQRNHCDPFMNRGIKNIKGVVIIMLPQNSSQKTVRQGIIGIFYLSGINKQKLTKHKALKRSNWWIRKLYFSSSNSVLSNCKNKNKLDSFNSQITTFINQVT